MEIVDFRTKTFGEIPKQDNPAYDVNECVLICKAQKDQTGLYVVMRIRKNQNEHDEVQQIGLFWDIDMALLFAENVKPDKNAPTKRWSTLLKHEFPLR